MESLWSNCLTSDGWKHQGGRITASSARGVDMIFNLHIQMSNTNYQVKITPVSTKRTEENSWCWAIMGSCYPLSTTQVGGFAYGIADSDKNEGFLWEVSGY